MHAPAQRATLVLEHASATDEPEEEGQKNRPWSVVAYLIYDNGQRRRATLCRRQSREEAAEALEKMWKSLSG